MASLPRRAIGLVPMQLVITETLAASVDAVFDVISDPRRRLEWQSSLRYVTLRTAGPARTGTAWYEVTHGGLRFELEITEHTRPSRWAERAQGRFADARIAVDFAPGPSERTTSLVVTVEIDFKGPAALAAPIVRATMPAALRADLRRAEALARSADVKTAA